MRKLIRCASTIMLGSFVSNVRNSRESLRERMLTASPAHNGSKKEAAVSELYVNELCNSYSAVTMSGSGSRLVGDTRRDDNIQTQQEFI